MREILAHFGGVPLRALGDKETLLSEGDRTGHLYALAEGRLEVLRGETQVALLEEPGSLIGEMAVLLDSPHTATVRALGEAKVYVAKDGADFLSGRPELAWLVSRLLARRLNAATTYLVDIKRQFAGYGNHLEMVGEVLESLMHQQGISRGRQASDRDGYQD
ncbi:Crp/Fnr family transcriptional regulator [Methylocystis echinoides]|jgi:CRP/FNR family cyclic AMP-dependent transcriptional regulator|uniref:Crp/Fnr family transcriptional regulator n=1 Tax=Methylocystis echinoides TaxID=29468 RepID=UPI00343D3893